MAQTSGDFKYPQVERKELIENFYGTNVSDPYRYLEDPDSDITKEFVRNQNQITLPFLEKCQHREKIRETLQANHNYKKIGCPFKRGQKYYLFMNSGLQPQSVLYEQDSVDSDPRVFFDPNTLSADGTVALGTTSFSPDHRYFAYSLSRSGSDWVEIVIKDLTTGENLPEKLNKAKFTSIDWTQDSKGFFYAQFPSGEDCEKNGTLTESNINHSIFYHKIGTSQSEDVLKVSFPEHPKWVVGCEVSHDGKYLFVSASEGCDDNRWYYSNLDDIDSKERLNLTALYEDNHFRFEYVTNDAETVYFRTNLDAKNFRIAKLDLNKPDKVNWNDVIPNHPEDVLHWAEVYSVEGKDYMLVNWMRKVVYHLELYQLNGQLVKTFNFPPGTISKHSGRRHHDEILFQFTSFLTPGQSYHFNLRDLQSEPKLLRQSQPNDFDPNEYTIEQVFYESHDKVKVPMFIVHRKDLVRDGSTPCLLYGYGGFNLLSTSEFSINRISWLKMFKGIYAVANIRGGGEFGSSWHDSGRLLNKQNCFNDFISAAEYLVSKNYTRPNRLVIQGGSNGGLLVAAVSNQRPDLFGAMICQVGVLDMIRFSSFTIGHVWMTEYGNPKEEEHFKNLIKYSPYHTIPSDATKYPATLVLTADHDDRVVPAHSLKFVSELQYKLGNKLKDTPLLIRIDTKAGHGAGKPVSKVIEEYGDIYSFLYNVLDLESYYSCENEQ